MTYKVAKSTCTRCHLIKPRNEMAQVEVDTTPKPRASVNPSKGLSSTRVYVSSKRTKKIWVCDKCLAVEKEQNAKSNKALLKSTLYLTPLLIAFFVRDTNTPLAIGLIVISLTIYLSLNGMYVDRKKQNNRDASPEQSALREHQSKINEDNRIC